MRQLELTGSGGVWTAHLVHVINPWGVVIRDG
jgi:hypothetical protein